MEKVFSLNQREAAAFAALVQEQDKVMAAVGDLLMQLEGAKIQMQIARERRDCFIRAAVMHRGVDQCNMARIADGNLICSLPDPPAEPPTASDKHVNGSPLIIDVAEAN